MTVVSVSMPEELLGRLDHFAETHGYTGRSEVVREAARSLLGEFEEDRFDDRALMGVVTALYSVESTPTDGQLLSSPGTRAPDRIERSQSHHRPVLRRVVRSRGSDRFYFTFIGKLRARSTPFAVEYSLVPVDRVDPSGGVHD